MKKFENKRLICSSCHSENQFLIIENVGCDWGFHTLIQCPECADLFSIDLPCNAFQRLDKLAQSNRNLMSADEILDYLSYGHICKT